VRSIGNSAFCTYDAPRPYYFASCENASIPDEMDFSGLPDRLTRLALTNLTIHFNFTSISPANVDLLRHRKLTVHFSTLRFVGTSSHDTRLPFHGILKNIAADVTSLTIDRSHIGHLHQSNFEGFVSLMELRLLECGISYVHPEAFYSLAHSNRPNWLAAKVLQPKAKSVLQSLDLRKNILTRFDWESLRPIAQSLEVSFRHSCVMVDEFELGGVPLTTIISGRYWF
jgi:hypothetical protein